MTRLTRLTRLQASLRREAAVASPSGARWLGLLGLGLVAGSAHASGGPGGAGDHAPHVANWFGLGSQYLHEPALGWLMVTFVLFALLIVGAARRPLGRHLQNRADGIRRALAEAQEARADAEARAAASEARLAQLDAEVQDLKAEFRRQGEAELARMEQAANAAAARLHKDAEDTLRAEAKRHQEALKREGARIALELAEQRVRSAVADGDRQRLTQNFIQDLSA